MRANWTDRLTRHHRPKKKSRKKGRKGKAKTRKRAGIGRRLVRRLVYCVLLLALLSWLPVLLLRFVDPPVTAFMLQDTSGRDPLLHKWSSWDELGAAAKLAVVAAEDQNFATHFGFDVKAIQQSLETRVDGGPLRGASTITQQVAKNLFLWPGKSFLRKGIEAYFAVLIEATWPKKRILEIYLNVAELGPGVYGVRSASEVYFGKSPALLSDAEAALLAAVLPNPKRLLVNRPSGYVRERQGWIMSHMRRLRREYWLRSVESSTRP